MPESGLKRTALSRRNLVSCSECGDELEDAEGNIRSVRWGFWDAEKQWFERSAQQDYYCRTCWYENYDREKAAHWEVEDAQKLWDVLEAANGELVADLKPIFIGGRPWIRVVDGELQGVGAHLYDDGTNEKGQRVLKNEIEEHDIDREWFDETFRADQELPDDAMPTIALLKPADETPFEEYENIDPHQQQLPEDEE